MKAKILLVDDERDLVDAYVRLFERGGYRCIGAFDAAAAKLFEPFFTTKPRGTGLGLWLSQRIIREHGGTLAAEPAPIKGTTFVITLPTIGDPQTAAAMSGARSNNQ